MNDSRERAQVIIDNGLVTEVCANNARPRTSAQTKEALQRLNSEHQVRRSRSVQPRSGFIGLPPVRQAEGASEGLSIRLRR